MRAARNAYFAFLLVSSAVYAQGTVTIFGVVTDSTGSLVPKAAVKVVRSETGAAREAISDDRGNYVVTQLPVGEYTVTVEAPGFKRFVQENIRVQVDENRQVNVSLEVGNVAESVTVRAEVAQVETRSAALREVVDSKRMVELPLNGRNALDLQLLVPGAGFVMAADQAQNTSVSINGTRTNANNYTLDGGDNHDPYFNSPSVFPNPDALAEF
ncbi:MAG: carboxypeptidase-like regulatory domain-containing protein, partial [Gammaproteobacteria bacterium]